MRFHKIKVDPLPERIKKSHSVKTVSHLGIFKIVVIKKKSVYVKFGKDHKTEDRQKLYRPT